MYTLESLEQELKSLGKTSFLDHFLSVRPLLPKLLKKLNPEDKVQACCLKCVGGISPGILVVLQDRLIFMKKLSLIQEQTDIYLHNIASFQNQSNSVPFTSTEYCTITIIDNGGSRYVFQGIISDQAERIIKVLNDKVKAAK